MQDVSNLAHLPAPVEQALRVDFLRFWKMLTLNPLEKLATNFSTPGFAEGFCRGKNIPILEKQRKTDDQTASLNWIGSTSRQRTGWFFETNAFFLVKQNASTARHGNSLQPNLHHHLRWATPARAVMLLADKPHRPRGMTKKRVQKSWGNFWFWVVIVTFKSQVGLCFI